MLNIDDRLLAKVNEAEYWLLSHITKRLNKARNCWPSNQLLLKETGWDIKKLQNVKRSLVEKGLLEIKERHRQGGGRSSNCYIIQTELIGVFVGAKSFGEQLEEAPTEKTDSTPALELIESPPRKTDIEVSTTKALYTEAELAALVIGKLNEIKKAYGIKPHNCKVTPQRQSMIWKRMTEFKGQYKVGDVIKMIVDRCEDWKNTEFAQYIRIETLFRSSKFIGYMEMMESHPAKDWTERAHETDFGIEINSSADVEAPENFKF